MEWYILAIFFVVVGCLGLVERQRVNLAYFTYLEKRLADIEARIGIDRSAFNAPVIKLILEGKKINAIKLYREQTGLGLREAKQAVEAIEATL